LKRRTRRKSPRQPQKTAAQRKMYSLRLYITGQTPRSAASIRNLREVCDEFLEGRFELQVIDLYQRPDLAKDAQVVAASSSAEEAGGRSFQQE
jgi:circadian clock protein KaiB